MLETLLKDLTAALNANTAAIMAGKTSAPRPATPPAPPSQAKDAEKPGAAGGDAKSDAKTTSYDEVKKVAVQLSKDKGRDALVAALEKFGTDHATKLKPEQYADFVKACNEALAAK